MCSLNSAPRILSTVSITSTTGVRMSFNVPGVELAGVAWATSLS
jgi:hypothetical protein